MILAGDIGGTKTTLGLFDSSGDGLREHGRASYVSRDFPGLEAIVERFRAEHPDASVDAACFGVAGAVIAGRAATTNLPWPELDQRSLSRDLGLPHVLLLNDLEATAYGVLQLGPEARASLHASTRGRRAGNVAVIAAGTGLGQAILLWDGAAARHRAVVSEGGHADFAPRSEQQIRLLRFLRSELGGRVSVERVLSGPGLHNLYRFLRREVATPEPTWLVEVFAAGDPSAVIAETGLSDRDPVCREALDLFASVYGGEAGDLALRCVALGGVILGGGIAPKILPALRGEAFRKAFTDKGRFQALVEDLDVSVALDPGAALLGAAHHAAHHLGDLADAR